MLRIDFTNVGEAYDRKCHFCPHFEAAHKLRGHSPPDKWYYPGEFVSKECTECECISTECDSVRAHDSTFVMGGSCPQCDNYMWVQDASA